VAPLAAQQPPVAFVDVTVIPMDRERRLEHWTVVVRSGRIAAAGPVAEVTVPVGATRVDGRGKYLMPGLAEMHAHLPNPNQTGVTPQLIEDVLFLYVANGVTVARGMLGNPVHLALRDSIARGQLLGPRLYVAGPALGGNQVPTPEEGRRQVAAQHAAGYDHLKIQEGLQLAVYDAITAAARAIGMRFAGHVPNDVPLRHALAAGQATVDHLDNYYATLTAGDSLPGLVATTRAAGTWVVPTLALWEVFLSDETVESLRQRPELAYVPDQWVTSWSTAVGNMRANPALRGAGPDELAARRRILKALADGGVGILFGTDSPQLFSVPGFSIHREMRLMTECGLTPYQVLASGSINVARFYGAEDDFGTVRLGGRADLILLDADPLGDVGSVARRAGVMVAGRWLPEEEIQRRLAEIAARY
jgi:imidazolonepropionase-like amidohydrolase